jgi:cyclopropane fatty-acyl-phospholipid synthase-like methyltransferase
MTTMKPFSEACERNKDPLLNMLRAVLADRRTVLEIGSGTGQHAVYFARHLPHLTWLTSDLPANHAGIRAWLDEEKLPNLRPPIHLDVAARPWPVPAVDAVFSANTAHILAWPLVAEMFAGIGQVLGADGILCLYGPFNYGGRCTSDSNASFDLWLKQRDPASAIRDFEAVDALARAQGLALVQDYAMPANNRTLVWRRGA